MGSPRPWRPKHCGRKIPRVLEHEVEVEKVTFNHFLKEGHCILVSC